MKKNILSISKKIIAHELIAGSFFVFIGSMINNVFSFIFNLFLARTFSTAEYGVYASLISLITLSSFLSQSLVTVFVKFAADYFSRGKVNEASILYRKLLRLMILISFVIFSIFILLSKLILNFLHIENFWYILLVAFITFISYIAIVNEAFLRSVLKFKFLSFMASLGSFVKLISGLLWVALGFGIFGALSAIVLNSIIPFTLAFFPLMYLWKGKIHDQKLPVVQMLSFAIPASITVLAFTSFITTDIILVKHFLSSSDAGLYGGLSLIGKVIFYFTYPIPLVMFPLIIKRYNIGVSFHKLFYLSLMLVLIPGTLLTIIYFVFPKPVISLFLGGRNYLEVSQMLGLFGIFISIYSLANVCINFFLSIGRANIFKMVLPASILQMLMIYFFHKDFAQVILVSIFSCGLLLITLLLYYYREFYGIYHAEK